MTLDFEFVDPYADIAGAALSLPEKNKWLDRLDQLWEDDELPRVLAITTEDRPVTRAPRRSLQNKSR